MHCSNLFSAPKQVESVLPETPSQQKLYDAKFREHFKKFDVVSLKTILKKLEYPGRLSYPIHKKELIALLQLIAPADLCETYPSPSDVLVPPKVPRSKKVPRSTTVPGPKLSPVESSKSGPGLGYFSYVRECQRLNDENCEDFWYFVPAKKKFKKGTKQVQLNQEQ